MRENVTELDTELDPKLSINLSQFLNRIWKRQLVGVSFGNGRKPETVLETEVGEILTR